MVIKVGRELRVLKQNEPSEAAQAALIEITRSPEEEGEGDLCRSRCLYDRNHTQPNELNISAKRVGKINCYIPDTPINYCNYDGN